jgi:hypothetical protein
LYPCQSEKRLELGLQHVVYTKFAMALEQIAKFEAGSLSDFTSLLQKKLDAKRLIEYNTDDLENIIAKGSGMIKNGENGKGIASRWYPKTLHDRIIAINHIKEKILFIAGDAFDILQERQNDKDAYFFIDPPYTVAGKRLYNYSDENNPSFEKNGNHHIG